MPLLATSLNLSPDFQKVVEKRTLLVPADVEGRLKKVTKTKPIKAKPLSAILSDTTMMEKLILNTLEGDQALKAGSLVCVGTAGDYWQQAAAKMLAKYTVTAVDDNGWMICTPIPGNFAFVAEVLDSDVGPDGFWLITSWGEERIIDGQPKHVQYGVAGDYLLVPAPDCKDGRIATRIAARMARKEFENYYDFSV